MQATKPKFVKKLDGKVVIRLDYRHIEEHSAPPIFLVMFMMQSWYSKGENPNDMWHVHFFKEKENGCPVHLETSLIYI